MMFRRDGFGRSIVFAALAAAASVPWLLLAGPAVGGRRALATYLVLVTATYVAGIAPSRRRALAAAALALGGGAAVLAVASHPLAPELALGLGVVLATVRSGVLFRATPARADLLEAVVVGGGLCFARALGGPGVLGVVLSLWGFFLVQSLFFLVGGVTTRTVRRHADPFDEACARAFAVLDGEGV
jgi:hypothetical protein